MCRARLPVVKGQKRCVHRFAARASTRLATLAVDGGPTDRGAGSSKRGRPTLVPAGSVTHADVVRSCARVVAVVIALVVAVLTTLVASAPPGAAATTVVDEASFRTAFADPNETAITLGADITLTCGNGGAANRASGGAISIDGGGAFSVTQSCADVTNLSSVTNVSLSGVTLIGGAIGLDTGFSAATLTDSNVRGVQSTGDAFGVRGARVSLTRVVVDSVTGTNAIGVQGGGGTVDDSTFERIRGVASATAVEGADTATGVVIDDVAASAGHAAGIHSYGMYGITVSGSTIGHVSGTTGAHGVEGATSQSLTDVDIHDISSVAYMAAGADVPMLGSIGATRVHVARISAGDQASALGLSARFGGGTGITVEDVTGGYANGLDCLRACRYVDSAVLRITGTSAATGIVLGSGTASGVTVAGVTAPRATGLDLSSGGGVFSTVINSTIVDTTGVGIRGEGSIIYTTIARNGSDTPPANSGFLGGAQLWSSNPGYLHLFGTVVTQPVGIYTNCVAAIAPASAEYSFADDLSCNLGGAGNQEGSGLDAQLGPLADNGGPTPTMAPADLSPLVDAIPTAQCAVGWWYDVTTDQRGFPRPASTGCDIGAVELQAPVRVFAPRFTG